MTDPVPCSMLSHRILLSWLPQNTTIICYAGLSAMLLGITTESADYEF